MKKKAGLVLFLLAGVAQVLAVAPVNPFYPKPEINRLTYEVVYEVPSSPVSGAMVTKWKYISELEIVRDPNVVGVIINGRDSGISSYGPVDSEYRDTCRINGNGIACASNGFLFLNDPRALYPNQGSYYTLGDSVYFSIEDSTPSIPVCRACGEVRITSITWKTWD